MRLSAEVADRGHLDYLRSVKWAGKDVVVHVDDKLINYVITADDELGFVKAYRLDFNGKPMINYDGRGLREHVIRGKVRISLKERAS